MKKNNLLCGLLLSAVLCTLPQVGFAYGDSYESGFNYDGNGGAFGDGGSANGGLNDTLIFTDDAFSFNAAMSGSGGAIYNTNSVTINGNSSFEMCMSGIHGGAIYGENAAIKINGSTAFLNNTSNAMGGDAGDGGAIYSDRGSLTLTGTNSFTTNGVGPDGVNPSTLNGGAIYGNNTKMTISGANRFDSNMALENGGAIYAVKNDVSIAGSYIHGSHANGNEDYEDWAFKNNQSQGQDYATGGGAVYLKDVANFTMKNTDFYKNVAWGDGGAIFLNLGRNNQKAEIADSYFYQNNATNGGAIFIQNTSANMKNLVVKGNSADSDGGGINIYSDKPASTISPANTFTNGEISHNTAGAKGGGMYVWGTIDMSDSTVNNNSANMGGGMYIASQEANKIDNVTFSNNSAATLGGGLTVSQGAVQINNSTFDNNTAGTRGGAISVLQNYTSAYALQTVFLINNDFTNNHADQEGGAIHVNVDPKVSMGDVSIRISDGQRHGFSGNTDASGSNAIYIEKGTVGLITQNDIASTLFFNDKINASGIDTTTDKYRGTLKVSGIGTTVFNNTVQNVSLVLQSGNLKIGEAGSTYLLAGDKYLNNVDLELKGGTFDAINDTLDVFNIRDFKASKDVKIGIDVDLSQGKSDYFDVNRETTGELLFDMDHFDLKIVDGDSDKFQLISYLTPDFNFSGKITQFTSTKKYVMEAQGDGSIKILKDTSNGLADALIADGDRVFRPDPAIDTKLSSELGAMAGDKLEINLDKTDMDAAGHGGIIVGTTKTLTIVNAGNDDGSKSWHSFNGTDGAAIKNAGTTNIRNSSFINNEATNNGGAISNAAGGVVEITDSTFKGNKAGAKGGAIYNNGGIINIKANQRNVIFTENTANGAANDIEMSNDGADIAQLNFDGSRIITMNSGISGEGIINKNGTGTLNIGGDNSSYTGDLNVKSGEVHLLNNAKFFNAANTTFENGTGLNLINNGADTVRFNNLVLNGNVNTGLDIDLKNNTNDKLGADSVSGSGKLVINNVNVISDRFIKEGTYNFNIIDRNADGTSPLLGAVAFDSKTTSNVYGPILRYALGYDPTTGMMSLAGNAGPTSKSYNPSVLAAPVAAQVGAYLNQLNSYEQAFWNMDMIMLMPREQRQAMKYANKYAAADSNLAFTPTMIPAANDGVWVRPYSTFESVKLKNGPKVSNVMYGSYFGGDMAIKQFKHGFDGVFSAYMGYNGSHQTYNGVGIYQNGGTVGLTGTLYKGNFFSGLTANVGASGANASTMYGNENFTMLAAGIASKTGYNWELAKGKFIIQPSYMMSYSFVNTFDYNNAAGVDIQANPLNVIQIAPGIKLIGNLRNGWQPYLGVTMVWNIMDDTRFKANDVSLPELSVDPFIMYGVGVQKNWGEKFTGYAQSMIRNGGRNGVGFQLGFRYSLI